ncbi:protein angel homolog 1 [Engraulis encrasicolus]|uniref:protein angel homolog 1 n=1 Tax=Engraulis encrasicolus TaxID=184585 RepID=UPI002FD70581
MLGSCLYYALYPLSRVITSVSVSLLKVVSVVLMNGEIAWDKEGTLPQLLACGHQTPLSNECSGEDYLNRKTEIVRGETKCPQVMELERRTDEMGPEAAEHKVAPKVTFQGTLETAPPQENTDGDKTTKSHQQDNNNMLLIDARAGGEPAPKRKNDKSDVQQKAWLAHELVAHTHFNSGDAAQGCPGTNTDDWPPLDQAGFLGSQTQAAATAVQGFHFPAGRGLTEVVYRPCLQFPSMSYYPPAQQDNTEFQVTWRVWEDVEESPPDGTTDETPSSASAPQQQEQQGQKTAGQNTPDSMFEFTVMSYNILAQDLLEGNPHLYTYCPEEALVWGTRLKGILKEIQQWKPDILCLQEAQEDHFKEQMQPVLTDMGYTCAYKRRTGSKTDGCAVCFQNSRFTQLSVSLLDLFKNGCEVLDRDNVAIVLLLQPVTSATTGFTYQEERFPPICIATTHLLFKPRRGDIKLAQLMLVLAEVDGVVRRCKEMMGRGCEVVLCGDFNSLPHLPLYDFITLGQLCYHGLPAWSISGQEDLSYQPHPRKLYSPLLPLSLGIDDNCQYVTAKKFKPLASGRLKYSPEFLLGLRFCPAALVRPRDLALIPGFTDLTPDPEDQRPCTKRMRNTTACHSLSLRSAYRHVIPWKESGEASTIHSNAGVTVDYIFYSARKEEDADEDQRDERQGGGGGSLKLCGRLGLLSESELMSMRGLPNHVFPSDHLSLLAKFQLPAAAAGSPV